MCCANRTFWFNLILWVLGIVGLAPMANEWAATFEDWTGVSLTAPEAVVMEYRDQGEIHLSAHLFGPDGWDEERSVPVVVTYHRSESERETFYTLGTRLAEQGFVAISFEYPSAWTEGATSAEETARTAMRWLAENRDLLHADTSRVALWAPGSFDSTPAQLALASFREEEATTADGAYAGPRALALIVSPLLLGSRETESETEEAADAAWSIDDVPSGVPFVALLVPQSPSQGESSFVEAVEAEAERLGIPCELVTYEGSRSSSRSRFALKKEYDAIASAMGSALLSSETRVAPAGVP